jgi:hypothetical protein
VDGGGGFGVDSGGGGVVCVWGWTGGDELVVCCAAGATAVGCEGAELVWVVAPAGMGAGAAVELDGLGRASPVPDEGLWWRAWACAIACAWGAERCAVALTAVTETGGLGAGAELDLADEPPHPASASAPVSAAAAIANAEDMFRIFTS